MKPKRKKKKQLSAFEYFQSEKIELPPYVTASQAKYISGFGLDGMGKESLIENGSHSHIKVRQPGAE